MTNRLKLSGFCIYFNMEVMPERIKSYEVMYFNISPGSKETGMSADSTRIWNVYPRFPLSWQQLLMLYTVAFVFGSVVAIRGKENILQCICGANREKEGGNKGRR